MPEAAPILSPQNQPDFISEPLYVDCAYQEQQTLHSRLLTTRLGRSIITTLAAASLYTGIGAANASSAEADAALVYEVGNTDGGVFSRNSPHTNDTPRIVGQGAYDGDKVELLCGVTNGDAVGPYSNNTWHYARNLSRPNQPNFWISDRHVMSPNRADQLAPGEKYCNDANSGVQNSSKPVNQIPATPIRRNDCLSNPVGSVAANTSRSTNGGEEFNRDAMNASQESQEFVCVRTQLSQMDNTNQRRFVSTVEGKAPYIIPAGCSAANLVEIWGDGFYKKTNCTAGEVWTINKWLKVGTYICAAISSATDLEYFKSEKDAAAAVESGRIKLGEADPIRSIICVRV